MFPFVISYRFGGGTFQHQAGKHFAIESVRPGCGGNIRGVVSVVTPEDIEHSAANFWIDERTIAGNTNNCLRIETPRRISIPAQDIAFIAAENRSTAALRLPCDGVIASQR